MSDPLDAVFVTDKDEVQRLKRSRQLVALAIYIDNMPMELKPLFKERFSLIDNAELAQLRADLQAAQERIAQLESIIALNCYVMPPFDLIDDATAQLALECAEKDRRIAEQTRQLAEARDTFIAIMPHLPISCDGYNTLHPTRRAVDAWLAAHPAPQEPQP